MVCSFKKINLSNFDKYMPKTNKLTMKDLQNSLSVQPLSEFLQSIKKAKTESWFHFYNLSKISTDDKVKFIKKLKR